MGRLEALAPDRAGEALAYLERRPYDNVYVGWLIRSGQAGRSDDIALWRDDAGEIGGLCYFGAQIVPSVEGTERERALDAFAERTRRARCARMIVGPRDAVDGLWKRTRRWMRPPRAVRQSQPVYGLLRGELRYSRADADVARATRAELGELVPHSAHMIAGEIGGDPARSNPDFTARTARIVDAGWWWRYRVAGRLAFMCHVGAATARTAQLQGVWTPPAMRGYGYASRALGAICDHLLDAHPSLCLYVNDYNAPAIALYERVGFRRAGEFATLLFD